MSKPTYVYLLYFVTRITNCLLYHDFAQLGNFTIHTLNDCVVQDHVSPT